ncbi:MULTISPECIES: TolC family protein [unclassified Meiothermus]|uniref:TolC family protein n=1 Tax=unclassified Meiothermus TaxID=370471 RepID=UPI00131500F3|nr:MULTISPECIES: TolC family protein [unclassified Meiothermus]
MRRLLAAGVLLVPALAFSPQEALGYRSPELAPAQERVEAAQARLEALRLGLSGSVNAGRQLWSAGEWSYGLTLTYQVAGSQGVQALRELEAARTQLQGIRRSGIQRALLAHARLWEAEATAKATALRAEAARQRLAEIERKAALGAVSSADREEARLAHSELAVAVRQAQNGLQGAQAEVSALGFGGNAAAVVLGFTLPETAPQSTPGYRDAALALQLAEARVAEARRALSPQVSLRGQFLGQEATVGLGLTAQGLGWPGANLQVTAPTELPGLPPGTPIPGLGEWRFTLSAVIALDPSRTADLRGLEAERTAAAVRLSALENDLARQLTQARQNTRTAQETLGLAEQRLALARRKRALAETRAQNGAASPLEVLEAQAQEADAEGRLAAAWRAYIEAVGGYLDLAGADWEVTP